MQNWRDYVGYQPISLTDKDTENTTIKLFYLTAIPGGVRILKEPFDLSEVVLSDSEVGDRVEELISQFPSLEIENAVALERAKLQVAKATGRGVATTNYNDTWFYKGANSTDAPIIVCGLEDKYYIFKHPNFNQYGFNVVKENAE